MTRSQTYSGKTLRNSEVHVDMVKKTVRFVENGDGNSIGGLVCVNLFLAVVGTFCIAGLLALYWYIQGYRGWGIGSYIFGKLLMILLFCGILYSSILYLYSTLDKNACNRLMPRCMARLEWGSRQTLTVNRKLIQHNSLVLPYFRNMYLGYEMTGDYAKYCTNIDILKITAKDTGAWQCRFTFKKTPIKGKMSMTYI